MQFPRFFFGYYSILRTKKAVAEQYTRVRDGIHQLRSLCEGWGAERQTPSNGRTHIHTPEHAHRRTKTLRDIEPTLSNSIPWLCSDPGWQPLLLTIQKISLYCGLIEVLEYATSLSSNCHPIVCSL